MSMSNITSIETEPIEMESGPTPQRVLGDEPGPGKDGETNGVRMTRSRKTQKINATKRMKQ